MAQTNITFTDKVENLNEIKSTINANATDAEARLVSLKTGWAYYQDAQYTVGSPLAPNASTRTRLTNDGLGSNTETGQLPSGVSAFWDVATDKLIGVVNGDSYDLTVDVPTQTESILIELDIGDGSPDIPIVSRTVSFGESGIRKVSIGFPYFSLATFVANGGKLFVTTSAASFEIYDIALLIKRDYSPQ
jgi:hypothetical protein